MPKDVLVQRSEDLFSDSSESTDDLDFDVDVDDPQTNEGIKIDTVEGKKSSKGDRTIYTKNHYCPFCGKKESQLIRHVLKKHRGRTEQKRNRTEEEVQKLQQLPTRGPKRNNLCALLRHHGNFLHNSDVLKKGQGSLIVERRPINDIPISQYLPCPDCLGFFSKDDLWKHSCPAEVKHSKNLKRGGKALLVQSSGISKDTAALMASLVDDEVSLMVKGDPLIVHFVESLIEKYGLDKKEYLRQRARQLGRS